MTPESTLLREVRYTLGRAPDVTIWRNNTGKLRDDRGRVVTYGLAVGSSDLVGVLAPWGRLVCLEIKVKTRLTAEQDAWLSLVRSKGAFGAVVHSTEEAEAALARARMECREWWGAVRGLRAPG